jgi:hypothetical protein
VVPVAPGDVLCLTVGAVSNQGAAGTSGPPGGSGGNGGIPTVAATDSVVIGPSGTLLTAPGAPLLTTGFGTGGTYNGAQGVPGVGDVGSNPAVGTTGGAQVDTTFLAGMYGFGGAGGDAGAAGFGMSTPGGAGQPGAPGGGGAILLEW